MPHYSDNNRPPIETTMIQGTNVNIGYAKLDITNHQVNGASLERRSALDLLRANCSLAALVDSNERYDPPRCTEATRRNVMRKMEDWVRHDGHRGAPSSIFWLYGGAGAGKSALAQTLAEKFKTNRKLAASFFFFKGDANRSDGNRLIPALTLQLIHCFPGMAPFVEEKILQNPDVFQKTRQTQMLELLVEPLTKLWDMPDGMQSNTPHPRLVVIDGLDECSDPNIQCDLLRIIASAVSRLPYSLRFLITSRPESHIARAFKHDIRKVAGYNLSDDSDADEDIRIFLEGEFSKIRRTHTLRRHLPSQWPSRESISSIVERSSGHFIYASTVIRFIKSPQHNPVDRLQVILGLKNPYEKDRPFALLDSLYTLIFLEIKDPGELEKIHRAFGIMYLRSLKSGLLAWPDWTSDHYAITTLLELGPGDVVLLFDPLLSLVTFDAVDIRIFHKSLFDYLLDPTRSGNLGLDLGLAHETAANYLLKHKNLTDDWDSIEFRDFTYHCQFATLNHSLKDHLRSLPSNITFTKSMLNLQVSSIRSCLLQSMLCFLQVISRPDFDFSGHCYATYVKKKKQYLKSVVPWRQRLKSLIPMLTRLEVIRRSAYFKRTLRSSLGSVDRNPRCDLKGTQVRDKNGFERTRIPSVNTSVIKSIKQEHEMFSSYVKLHHRYPDIVVSLLVQNAELFHSCHFVIRALTTVSMTFLMLVTYTESGIRLSCSEFEALKWPQTPDDVFEYYIGTLVEQHLWSTGQQVGHSHTVRKVFPGLRIPMPASANDGSRDSLSLV